MIKKLYFVLIAFVLLTIESTLFAQSLSLSGQSPIYADESGYAGTTIYTFPSGFPYPTSYVWSATWEGSCDRWYIWPNGTRADLSVYFTLPQQEGGVIIVECSSYNGSTLLATAYYYVYVYPVSFLFF